MLTPALKELSKQFKIDLLIFSKYKEVFLNLIFINNIFTKNEDIKNIDYDKKVDLSDYEFNYEQIYQPNIQKTKQDLFSDVLNVKISDFKPIIKLTKEEISFAKNYLDKINRKIILIAPLTENISRNWPLNKWKDLINKIKKLNYQIIIVDKKLKWADEDLLFFNNHTLRELFSLVAHSDFVICNDSGLLHIAGAFEKTCLGIFGPTNPNLRCIYKNSYSVREKKDCSPCWYNRCDKMICMKELSVNIVENKFLEVVQIGY